MHKDLLFQVLQNSGYVKGFWNMLDLKKHLINLQPAPQKVCGSLEESAALASIFAEYSSGGLWVVVPIPLPLPSFLPSFLPSVSFLLLYTVDLTPRVCIEVTLLPGSRLVCK